MERRQVYATNSSLISLPGSSATNVVGCWEAQASRFPAVQQPIWKGAKSLAPCLPNFQATWQPAWCADGKPGRPWELLIPSTHILSGLGHLSSSSVPELPGNHSPHHHALNQDATQANTPAPCLPIPPPPQQNHSGSSFMKDSERIWVYIWSVGKRFVWRFLKWLNHSKTSTSFFFFSFL